VLNAILQLVVQRLTFKHSPSAKSGYCNVRCAAGNYRHCKLVLAVGLGDYPEYSDLHHIKRYDWFWCECSMNELLYNLPPDKYPLRWDHNLYRTLRNSNSEAANAELLSRHVHPGFKVFRNIPCIACDYPTPDLLHSMQIGRLDHLHKWIFHFMKMHEWLDKYNAIWLSVPAYHNLPQKTKSYEEVSQWNAKQMKEMSWYLLGVVTQSLWGGSPVRRPIFNPAIECTRAVLEYYT